MKKDDIILKRQQRILKEKEKDAYNREIQEKQVMLETLQNLQQR